ncbi:DUF4367 domain-containing protein [Desulfosporosinus meridiei]|uniref:DUF4367 domain-containing protein n=1 Tax=Desulfosporosinus meridiei (strain ATCC BAA-275 / DSM 13257 / KCTC 12902 / NCIMB 13706 / S10) TaxID=768704 RepID=J7ITL5_DESMD|nr:DUF4367 domain-containing protein [Desulfosporosinus meridiei]AFQ43504.1 hypothetical protein Desmer_1511 [Desulfosporosinus meridiei DSM 13257]
MALSEKELERIIKSHLSKELDAAIEVPNIDDQWQKIKQQILETESIPTTAKPFSNRKRIVVAATILISIGSINFLYPHNANALGGKIGEFFAYIVGKTTQNQTETYKQVNDPDMPKIKNLGSNIEKEVTLDQAQAEVPFKLAIPSYLPTETNVGRVTLTSLGADVYEISIEYNFSDKVIVLRQQNSANGTSRGSLYDTDDTVTKDLIVNGSPAMLFASKNGLNTLNWQIRGLLLQITGEIAEEEIIKIGNSIK